MWQLLKNLYKVNVNSNYAHPYASTISWYGFVKVLVRKYVGGDSTASSGWKIMPTWELLSKVARCSASCIWKIIKCKLFIR